MKTISGSYKNTAIGAMRQARTPRRTIAGNSSTKHQGGKYGNAIQSNKLGQGKNKMKFSFKRWVRNWLYDTEDEQACSNDVDSTFELESNSETTIHFAVIAANGGRIVQVRYYDRVKDRNVIKLHIIAPDENLAESLAHILQLEIISR